MRTRRTEKTVIDLSFDEVKHILAANIGTFPSDIAPVQTPSAPGMDKNTALELRPDGLTLTVEYVTEREA